jgi:dTDP-glucose 4,6-dehydratase
MPSLSRRSLLASGGVAALGLTVAGARGAVADGAGHDQRYAIESGKLRLELGWQPRYDDLEAGLAQTIDWYRDHRDWWEPQKAATEASYAAKGM